MATVIQDVAVECQKLKHKRLILIGSTVILAGVLLSSGQLYYLFKTNRFHDPMVSPWPALLMTLSVICTMLWPMLAAILASQIVDIEHESNGWMLAQMSGLRRGDLCRRKLLTLIPVIVLFVVAQFGLHISLARAVGADNSINITAWGVFATSVLIVAVVLVALQICVSAWWENQAIGIALGVVGSFLGVFALFMPPLFAHLIPWGYFAVSLPVTTGEINGKLGVVETVPDYLGIGVFAVVGIGLFWLVTTQLNRKDV